jgi:uncharacterized protein YnzC (UPF0291/DUF896 family)
MGPKKVKEMDEAAKRAAGSPGYDDDTMEAIKQLERKEKSKGLTASEEKELDRLNRRMVRESGAERAEDMPKSQKPQRLTDKQKKEMQESLNFKKGGMPTKKMMGGGMAKYAKGGMSAANYAKGGVANCGASVKPSGGSRNK